ncbi:N(alpha)-acetyltransferase 20, NatB catalytic subunit [Dissostichus eleginoides]|nr:N(alpha)-acetyltransferase 20, NatB catalytic subunit [Dissostichus eleginoides]
MRRQTLSRPLPQEGDGELMSQSLLLQKSKTTQVRSVPVENHLCLKGMKGGFFVDLFVRVSNQVAVNMYKRLGYSVYRTVIEYYSASNGEPDEDAYDMRKALSRDMEKKSIVPLPHPVRPEDIE